jgi:heterodisulfide reductase subunit B
MGRKYAYYPGCSLHSTAAEYDISFRAVCEKLDIELQEIGGWICCGTSAAHSTSRLLSLALPLENLRMAGTEGFKEVVAPCAACFSRLKHAQHETAADPELGNQLTQVIDAPLPTEVRVLHPLEIFDTSDVGTAVTTALPELKVVCYYGCLLTRPPEVMQFDECEYPMSMDRLLQALGIATLDWSYKTECCGGAFALTETDVVLKLTHDILENAKAVGANAIAAACPLCHANLDTRQAEIEVRYESQYHVPVFYFTQLIGLALGIPPDRLGIQRHFVSADELLSGVAAGGWQVGGRVNG